MRDRARTASGWIGSRSGKTGNNALVPYTDLLPLAHCLTGTDAEMLTFALDRARIQFAWKADGLSADQLRQRLPPSEVTLGGLLKHLAFVEDRFTAEAQQQEPALPWDTMSWTDGNRWAWTTADQDSPEDLYALYYAAVARSQRSWADMIDTDGIDVVLPPRSPDYPDYAVNRRRILVDMWEEYLKHTGHADLIREWIDGRTGNDPDDE